MSDAELADTREGRVVEEKEPSQEELMVIESNASAKERLLRYLDPFEWVQINRYTNYVKLPKEIKRELTELTERKRRGVGGKVTLRILLELAADKTLDFDEPLFVWIYRSPLIKKVVYDASKDARLLARLPRTEFSRPKTRAEMRRR